MEMNLTANIQIQTASLLKISGNLMLASAFFVGLTSCGTISRNTTQFASATIQRDGSDRAPKQESNSNAGGNWVLVSIKPQTFHPNGVGKNAKTDPQHGRWITLTKTPAKWFVPHGGIIGRSELDLLEEVFAMRMALIEQTEGQFSLKPAIQNTGKLAEQILATGLYSGFQFIGTFSPTGGSTMDWGRYEKI